MPLEALNAPASTAVAISPWRRSVIVVSLSWLALIAAFASDWLAIFDQWWNSSTYNHILLIPAIVGWLFWQRFAAAAQLTPQP